MPAWWPPRWGQVEPPGSAHSILPHPTNPIDRAIEVAVFQEHRFAFYFWAKWALEAVRARPRGVSGRPPALVSLDWHQDLCAPSAAEREDLDRLNLTDLEEVGLFSWTGLCPKNDGHILAAAYTGLIGDIYVLCKMEDEWLEEFRDKAGKVHRTFVFHSLTDLLAALPHNEEFYFDVDLDYFTESDEDMGGGEGLRLVGDAEVRRILDPLGPLMRAVLPRIAGFTIAMEPEWCGGARQSHHLFDLLDETLFDPGLLNDGADWRTSRR